MDISKEPDDKGFYTIYELYVKPEFRSQGLGHLMLQYTKDNFHKLGINVLKENTKAKQLYEREGFKVCDIHEQGFCLEYEEMNKITFSDLTERLNKINLKYFSDNKSNLDGNFR